MDPVNHSVTLNGTSGLPVVVITTTAPPNLTGAVGGGGLQAQSAAGVGREASGGEAAPAVTVQIQVFEGKRAEATATATPSSSKTVTPTRFEKSPAFSKPTHSDALRMQKKDEHFKKLQEKFEQEKELLYIGRTQLQAQIKEHRTIMEHTIAELNEMNELEQKMILDAVTREIEQFNLPGIKQMIPTDKVDALIEEAKQLEAQCRNAFHK